MEIGNIAESRLFLLNNLQADRLMVSDVEVIDDDSTACINLITKKVSVGFNFIKEVLRSIEDLKFLIKQEVHHRFITNQWNKMNLILALLKVEKREIDWKLVNVIEDAFINAYVRNSGNVVSDFPEYFYKTPDETTIWLSNNGNFDRNSEWGKYVLLYTIRNNAEFFIDLNIMAELYAILYKEKHGDKDGNGKDDSKGGKGGKDRDNKGSSGDSGDDDDDDDDVGMPVSSIDDPLPNGSPTTSDGENQQKVVTDQIKEAKETKKKASEEIGRIPNGKTNRVRAISVPDINKDIDLAKVFNIKTTQMKDLEVLTEGKNNLVSMVSGIKSRSRVSSENYYFDPSIPSVPCRKDLTLMSMGRTPTYWKHELPMGQPNDSRWNIYLDVSSSMSKEIPLGRWVAQKLEKLCKKVYTFPAMGAPISYNLGTTIYTNRSTDMSECFIHCFKDKIDHMIIIGDAEDSSYQFNYLPPDVAKWAKKAETVMIMIGPLNSYFDRALTTFKYVYNLNTDKLFTGNYGKGVK